MQKLLVSAWKRRFFPGGAKSLLSVVSMGLLMLFGVAADAGAKEYVYTIYFGGTGLHTDAYKPSEGPGGNSNLIAMLNKLHTDTNDSVREHKHKFIPGVSAKPDCGNAINQIGQKKDPHSLDGIFWCRNWRRTVNDASDFLKDQIGYHDPVPSGKPAYPVHEYEDTVIVNIVGHSRGAIALFWFLQLLEEKNIDSHQYIDAVNMIALDPVPGANLQKDTFAKQYRDMIEIGWNAFDLDHHWLKKFVAVYVMDERCEQFSPLVPKFEPTLTESLMLRIRGAHQTIVGNRMRGGHAPHLYPLICPWPQESGLALTDFCGGDINEDDIKATQDLAAIIIFELLGSPEWGSATFSGDYSSESYVENFLSDVYSYGSDEDTRRDDFIATVDVMNTTEALVKSWGYYEVMQETAYFPFATDVIYQPLEHFDGLGCAAIGFELVPPYMGRCMIRIVEESGSLKPEVGSINWENDIYYLNNDSNGYSTRLSGYNAWERVYQLGYPDDDSDRILNDNDNCPQTPNPLQENTDFDESGDNEGDACDPVAVAAPDNEPYVQECTDVEGAYVDLDGSQSYDPDGDILTYDWVIGGQSASVIQPTVKLHLGPHNVELEIADDDGYTDLDYTTVTVQDTQAPDITEITADPAKLWPPNKKMRDIAISVEVADICSASASIDCYIAGVSSNEPIKGIGYGKTSPDWILTGDLTLKLRAERAGKGSGRVYTVNVNCEDDSGNISTATATISVPHNKKGLRKPHKK